MNNQGLIYSDLHIRKLRAAKNQLDPYVPYAFFQEEERRADGQIVKVNTIFLTNRECRFTCLMCDLWKNSTDSTVPDGAIASQIRLALSKLPPASHLKLYNGSSFFDPAAIPEAEYPEIARLVEGYEHLVVENHPKLLGEPCLRFASMIKPRLQVAMGLESVHPGGLRALNKKMSLADFQKAVKFLKDNKISSRAFIMLRPPGLSEEEGRLWAGKSIVFAFESGCESCVVIPTRVGNGAMDLLQNEGRFTPPRLSSLEQVMDFGIRLNKGLVFADTWDLEKFSDCPICFESRRDRLEQINLEQSLPELPLCMCR